MIRFKGIFVSTILLFGCNAICAAESSCDSDSKFIYPDFSKKISMDFKDAALSDVLKIFSQQSGMNFIASTDLANKKVTLFFENVPVEEALQRILNANDLTYEQEEGSDIFLVKLGTPAGQSLMTRVYFLKHATVSSSKLNKTIVIKPDSDGDASGGGSSPGGGDSSGSSASAGGLVAAIKAVLSASGKLIEDPRTNSLVITDIESRFPMIEETIARLDVAIPEILIEVEMLDVSKGTADLIGVKLGDTPLKFSGGQRDHVYPWNQNMLLDKGYAFEEAEYRVGTIDASGLTATLQFLRTRTDTKSLARPRLLTLNNETAQIRISTDEAIGLSTQSVSQTGSTTSEAERVQTGVFLTVTPQANLMTRDITMAVAPKVIQARDGGTFAGQTFKDPEERGSRSILKVKSGETIILGGLLRTEDSKIVNKVPVLGDIPLLGMAFRHKNHTVSERELIIFITPYILDEKTKARVAADNSHVTAREQDIPSTRLKQIQKEINTLENQRY